MNRKQFIKIIAGIGAIPFLKRGKQPKIQTVIPDPLVLNAGEHANLYRDGTSCMVLVHTGDGGIAWKKLS